MHLTRLFPPFWLRSRETSRRRTVIRRGRSLQSQRLEDRRLLVAEGEVFSLSQVVNTAGLVGAITSTVRWGDGSESAASVSALPTTGPLKIRLDYSLDRGFFATQARRDLLQLAADTLVSRFNDDLAAIIPSGINTWTAVFTDPGSGVKTTRVNLAVAANEIVVFAGSRDLPGSTRGFGGPGGWSSFGSPEWNTLVAARGEAGAAANPATDFGPWGGSIAFDDGVDSNWFFSATADGIKANEIDFLTVATHEFAHVLGFGFQPNSSVSSWENLASTGSFRGPKAIAAFATGGNVPLQTGDIGHWQEGIQSGGRETLMDPTLPIGSRMLMSPLDFAAFDDLGWDVDPSNVTVTATHTFADNGLFPVEIIVSGGNGRIVTPLTANITNVAPLLTTATDQSVIVGETLTLANIGQISDPGFANPRATPATAETFTYSINWGDQSAPDTGVATIDRVGSVSLPTLASLDGSHTYRTAGTYTVTIDVTDDDRGSARKTLVVAVLPRPTLSLALDKLSVPEDAGNGAATLTITRSGPARTTAQLITLSASDASAATLPPNVTIPAGQTSVTVGVRAIDDAILDGEQRVTFTASGDGIEPATIELSVTDRERISASFNVAAVREAAAAGSLSLTVSRSNTNNAAAVNIDVTGGLAARLVIPSSIVIPAGASSVAVALTVVNDSLAQRLTTLTYTFASVGYASGTATIDIVDDEPPKFQNPVNRFNVNNGGSVTAGDALEVINELNRLAGSPELDPATNDPNGLFIDVNGDYRVTALDALEVINELNRLQSNAPPGGEAILVGDPLPSARQHDQALTELMAPVDEKHATMFADPVDIFRSLTDDESRRHHDSVDRPTQQLF